MKEIDLNVIATLESIAKLIAFFWPLAGEKMTKFVAKMKLATPLWASVMANFGKLGTALSLLGLAINGVKAMGPHWNWACIAAGTFGVIISIYASAITTKDDKPVTP